MQPVLTAGHLGKRYGQVEALLNASIDLVPGTIHGLVGENGAGKSTLVRLLAGIEPHDTGTVTPDEDVRKSLCAVVPQYPRMAPSLPLLQNLIIGAEPRVHPYRGLRLFINYSAARRRMEQLSRQFDIELDLGKPAGSLNGTELRLAAVLSALGRDSTILILDEPTVGLAITDQERVLSAVRALRDRGLAILYISHDLAEVSRLADRITVLIQGRTTQTFDTAPDARALAALLFDHRRQDERKRNDGRRERPQVECGRVGAGANDRFRQNSRTTLNDSRDRTAENQPAEPAIAFEDVSLYDRYSGRTMGPLSFTVAPGKISAVTGVREAGLDLLEHYLSGDGELASGSIRVAGHRIPAVLSPGALREQGITFLPSDRFEQAATLEGTVEENATVTDRRRIHPRGIRNPGEAKQLTTRLLERFDIRTHRHVPLGSLSGGMIQKLILARELDSNPGVCIVAEPTAGLDMQSQQILLESLRQIAAEGSAVIILSSSIDAVTTLAQEVVVLHDGVVQGVFPVDETDRIARAFAGLNVSGE